MKAEVYGGARTSYQGKFQNLLDHPAIVRILSEILSEQPFIRNNCYSFRFEGSFTTVRPPQQANAMRYQVAGGHFFSQWFA